MGCGSSKGKKFKKSIVELSPSLETCRFEMSTLDNAYQCTKELGFGLSGPVLLASHHDTGDKVAVKGLKKNDYYEGKIMLNGEVKVYMYVDHPNIARLLQVFEDDDYVYLVMEFCEGGSLHQRLTQKIAEKSSAQNPSFPEAVCGDITRQMLLALNYCHEHDIVHRDLKLENWVFEGSSIQSCLKLIDFGFARFCAPDTKMSRLCGSAPYASPELLNGSYNMKAEMWALGVIVYMLLVGYPPFHGSSQEELFAKIRTGKYMSMTEKRWETVSQTAKDFVCSLLLKDPDRRLTSKQAVYHSWLKKPVPKPVVSLEIWDNMLKYSQATKFKRACFRVLAYFVPQLMLKDAQTSEFFLKLAASPRGTLTLEELREATSKLDEEVSGDTVSYVFNAFDIRKREEVMYCDFLAGMMGPEGCGKPLELSLKYYKMLYGKLAEGCSPTAKITVITLSEMFGETLSEAEVNDMMQETMLGKSLDFDAFMKAME